MRARKVNKKIMDNNIQLNWFKNMEEYLQEMLRYASMQMFKADKDKDGIDMRSVYHGQVLAYQDMLRKLYQLKVIEEQTTDWQE